MRWMLYGRGRFFARFVAPVLRLKQNVGFVNVGAGMERGCLMTSNKFRIHGLSPEGTDHEWTGCGWADENKGASFSDVDSWLIERRMNRACNMESWIAWRVAV